MAIMTIIIYLPTTDNKTTIMTIMTMIITLPTTKKQTTKQQYKV